MTRENERIISELRKHQWQEGRFDPLKSQSTIDFERTGRSALFALAIIAGLMLAVVAGAGLLIWGMMG